MTAVLRRWFDTSAAAPSPAAAEAVDRIDWARVVPFLGMHVACLAVLAVGWSPVAVSVAAALYLLRMFAITAFYHRYFSHRAFKTSRAAQFAFALLGASAVQRGPLWWAGHHRLHHRRSDGPDDAHSPRHRGFLWSHLGWFLSRRNFATPNDAVRDLARYPELRFLDRYDTLVPALLALGMLGLGALLERVAPGLGTNAWQMLVWGFVVSTVVLFHATFTINSLAHTVGRRRYATRDTSRNNAALALLTLGEGWHNNHHHYPHSTRQGFFWWELDPTWWGLVVLSWLGVVWDLKPVPAAVRDATGSGS
ncbi:MAG: acyl-CoA desaturase [Planctomycetota bacterium JB042]